MALLVAPALLAPLPPARGASEEALRLWRAQISSFLESLAFSLEEVGDAYLSDSSQIVDGVVSSVIIADGSVTTAKLANTAVTTAKIADANVTAVKLATDSVTPAKIEALAVTTAKIAANAVTADVFGSGGPTTFGSTEVALVTATLSTSTGKAQIFSSALFSTTGVGDQTVTYRVRKDSITGTVLRTATVVVLVASQVSHKISALDTAPATSQAYVLSVVASAGSALVAQDYELLATGFNK